MADPADIGPQYQCDECGVWSPDTTCVQCGAELGEANKLVPGVFAKNVVAEGQVAPPSGGIKFFTGNVIACASSPHYGPITGGSFTFTATLKLTPESYDAFRKMVNETFGPGDGNQ